MQIKDLFNQRLDKSCHTLDFAGAVGYERYADIQGPAHGISDETQVFQAASTIRVEKSTLQLAQLLQSLHFTVTGLTGREPQHLDRNVVGPCLCVPMAQLLFSVTLDIRPQRLLLVTPSSHGP